MTVEDLLLLLIRAAKQFIGLAETALAKSKSEKVQGKQ